MAKDLTVGILLDFYGGLLTEKQATTLDYYYNQDLSLGEIADDMGISRQGAMAFIKQGEKHLKEFEEKLGLYKRFDEIKGGLDTMRELVGKTDINEKKELLKLIDSISATI